MKKLLKRISLYFFGVCFLILGILGLVLPVLQGFLFIAIGVFFLTLFSPGPREWIKGRVQPYPKVLAVLVRVEEWSHSE